MDLKEPVTQLIVQFRIHRSRQPPRPRLGSSGRRRTPGRPTGARPRHGRWGDIGSGSINVFVNVDPDRWEAAWAAVRSKLVDLELLQRVVVARRGEDSAHEVLWPEDYGQESRLWEEPHYYLA